MRTIGLLLIASASSVRISVDSTPPDGELLPLRELVARLCTEDGLAVRDDGDIELALTATIQYVGPARAGRTPEPELRWDPAPQDYLEYRGARVSGAVELAGHRLRFDGLVPGFGGSTEIEPPVDSALPVVDSYVGNALVESRLLDRLALLLGRARGPDRLLPATLDHEPILADAALAALDRLDPDWPRGPAAAAFVPELVRTLASNDAAPRRRAAELLPRIDPRYLGSDAFRAEVPALIEAAQCADPWLGADARAILQQVDDPVTAELLVPLLDHADPKIRTIAYATLVRLRDPRVVEPLIRFAQADMSNGWSTDVGEWSPPAAAAALGELGDPRAVEPLLALLDEPFTGDTAIAALGRIRDPRAVGALLQILGANDGSQAGLTRAAAAATALAAMGETSAVEPLIRRLSCWDSESEGSSRRAFVDALVTLHDPRAADALVDKAQECHWPASTRATYLRALSSFDGPEVRSTLRYYSRPGHDAPEVVRAAREARR